MQLTLLLWQQKKIQAHRKRKKRRERKSKKRRKRRTKRKRKPLSPDDDIHDQEVPNQADDTDNHVDDHHSDLDAGGQQSLRVVVVSSEVVLEECVIVELQVAQLGQQKVVGERHPQGRSAGRGHRKRRSQCDRGGLEEEE